MPLCRKHRPAYGRSAAAVSVGGSYKSGRNGEAKESDR